MLFNSFEYLLFLPIVFLLYWFVFDYSLSKCKHQLLLQNLFIVVASYIFYGWWDWRFLILIAITTILSFLSGIGIEKAPTQRGKKAVMIANRHKIKWLSEPDMGIYNAMNKGVRMVQGEYTLMLNSGDYLVDERVIENVLPLLDGTDIIQGNTIEEYPDRIMRNRGYGKSDIDFFDVMKGHFLHQAAFCRRDLFDRYGMFDESYRIIGDTKFFMTCLGKENALFKYIDLDISNYDMTGITAKTTGKWVEQRKAEVIRMRDELYSNRLNYFF